MLELSLNHITMRYKENAAVRDASYKFHYGVYGLLGANGAGKTTLMRMICGILAPTEGEILCDGEEIRCMGGRYRRLLGYLPQDFGYYPEFSAEKFLQYMARLKAIPAKEMKEKTEEMLQITGLFEVRKKKIKTFSGGMKRRLGIAQALLNDPEILILDEPTAGLDPKERIRFRNMISRLSKDRVVILSTHIVPDIEYIADEILLMKKGEIIRSGAQKQITDTVKDKVWEILTDSRDVEVYMQNYAVSNLKSEGDKTRIRIVSDVCPSQNAVMAVPALEDVYLYYFQDEQ